MTQSGHFAGHSSNVDPLAKLSNFNALGCVRFDYIASIGGGVLAVAGETRWCGPPAGALSPAQQRLTANHRAALLPFRHRHDGKENLSYSSV